MALLSQYQEKINHCLFLFYELTSHLILKYMQIKADTPEHYIDQLPDERKEAII